MSTQTIELKTLKELNREIKSFEQEIQKNRSQLSDSQYTKACNKVAFMRKCAMYLSDEPRQEFVEKELQRMESRMAMINSGFDGYVDSQPKNASKMKEEYRAEYNTLMGVKTIKAQIKTLRYLLNMIEV